MGTNQNTNKNNNQEPSFDEYQAYEELRLIFVIAIETQNFTNIEARISAWEKKYPLAEFTNPEIIRKIKTILNKDFLSRLLGDYLAAKVLHEQEKQKKAYDSLKEIIDNAKKSKNYKTAQKEIRKWKDNLHDNGFSLYDFNRLYRARVCTLLLLPSKELKNQEQATDELKKIKENGNSMDSEAYSRAINDWQNTYSIANFPEKLQKELNQITTEVFDSISQKRTSENAISEIEAVLDSKDNPLPANAIASILSKYDYKRFSPEVIASIEKLSMQAMSIQESTLDNGIPDIDLSVLPTISPIEARALTDLRDILNKTPHDMDTILNWIYVNRKINYSEFAREKIINQFLSVGYKIPVQNSYSIPETNPNLDYKDFSKVDDLRQSVILNYLGIISQGNKITTEGKDNIIEAHAISTKEVIAEQDNLKPTMFLEVFDDVIEQPETETEDEKTYNEKGEIIIDKNEELIYNIFIEDIIDNPLATYSIATATTDKSVEPLTKQPTVAEELPVIEEPTVAEELPVIEESTVAEKSPVIEEPTVAEKSPVIEEPVLFKEPEKVLEASSQLEDKAISMVSEEVAYNDSIIEEPQLEATTSPDNTDYAYSLTIQDDENLEQAQSLSTYVVVAAPILAQVLEPKLERSQRKSKIFDRNKDL